MKVIFFAISLILITNILSMKYTDLSMNRVYDVVTKNEEFNYFKFSLKNLTVIPSEITIETTILKSDNITIPIIGVFYEPIRMRNYKNLVKSKLGQPVILNSLFIKSALQRKGEIYMAIYSKNSAYKINILPVGNLQATKHFVQIPIRGLAEETNNTITFNDVPLNSTENRMAFYSGDGIGTLMSSFIMLFVSIIGSLIMMNIYVHNTALVEQPLKLGRIEA